MNNEQKKSKYNKISAWLANLSYLGVLVTLILIMVQVFYAKQTMTEAHDWEKAKMTIENIDKFKEHLKETALYGKTEALNFSDRSFPDFTTSKGYERSDSLRLIYWQLCDSDLLKLQTDLEKTLGIFDNFAYPIIMGYASEMGSYQVAAKEFYLYGNYIMPIVFNGFPNTGHFTKLLWRLWRVRTELTMLNNTDMNVEKLKERGVKNINDLLCFEGKEITATSLEKYHEKLEKELKKIQKEIEIFRKNNLK